MGETDVRFFTETQIQNGVFLLFFANMDERIATEEEEEEELSYRDEHVYKITLTDTRTGRVCVSVTRNAEGPHLQVKLE